MCKVAVHYEQGLPSLSHVWKPDPEPQWHGSLYSSAVARETINKVSRFRMIFI